eukprot:TRINITY_DN774282_c0_g1_i1.p1 TRINITY_DN774282_c0_g1~~TRINITY_DN774282_c0_g1_i1.p1  ORF type:complete len:417 (+),score=97.16 TRINITY_DN774282_c0_g1_i1:131-1381(+)
MGNSCGVSNKKLAQQVYSARPNRPSYEDMTTEPSNYPETVSMAVVDESESVIIRSNIVPPSGTMVINTTPKSSLRKEPREEKQRVHKNESAADCWSVLEDLIEFVDERIIKEKVKVRSDCVDAIVEAFQIRNTKRVTTRRRKRRGSLDIILGNDDRDIRNDINCFLDDLVNLVDKRMRNGELKLRKEIEAYMVDLIDKQTDNHHYTMGEVIDLLIDIVDKKQTTEKRRVQRQVEETILDIDIFRTVQEDQRVMFESKNAEDNSPNNITRKRHRKDSMCKIAEIYLEDPQKRTRIEIRELILDEIVTRIEASQKNRQRVIARDVMDTISGVVDVMEGENEINNDKHISESKLEPEAELMEKKDITIDSTFREDVLKSNEVMVESPLCGFGLGKQEKVLCPDQDDVAIRRSMRGLLGF